MARAFLPRLPAWTGRRRAVARAYLDGLRNPAVRPIDPPAGAESVWHLFPVVVPAARRDAFRRHLEERGIQSAVHYPRTIPRQPALAGTGFEVHGTLEVAEALAATEVSLPVHPYLTDAEVARVVDAVNAWSAP
jgi:dTDP-3-amino-3,4,6-trideoxy-alpha-D-glucose transaminase